MTSIVLALMLALSVAASAQELPKDATATQLPQQTPDYQIGPGDLLSINVSGLREFEQSTRVSNSGRIRVPYVGVMFVSGMTPLEVEGEVARLIKEHELINEPTVRVRIEEFRAQPAYVIGQVTNPGQFVITGETYLLDLISRAGGLLASAETTGFLCRRRSLQPGIQARIISDTAEDVAQAPLPAAPDTAAAVPPPPTTPDTATAIPPPLDDAGKESVLEVNLDELRTGARPEMNLKMQGGDVLYVPARRPQNFYVIGDVKVPGAYAFPRGHEVTAAQAIVFAGGTLATASNGKGFLMRHDAAGVRQAIPVDFRQILSGKEPDFPIRPDDIIFVPNSALKTIGVGFLEMVPTLIQQWLIF